MSQQASAISVLLARERLRRRLRDALFAQAGEESWLSLAFATSEAGMKHIIVGSQH